MTVNPSLTASFSVDAMPAAGALPGRPGSMGIWSPGIRLFRSLKFRAKAALISLAFLLPLGCLLSAYVPVVLEDLRTAEKEQVGVKAFKAWVPVMRALADARNVSRVKRSGSPVDLSLSTTYDQVDLALQGFEAHLRTSGDGLELQADFKKLQAEWNKVAAATKSPDASPAVNYFIQLTDMSTKMAQDISANSGLALDPATDSFYIMNAITIKMPDFLDDAGQIRGWSVALLARPEEAAVNRLTVFGARLAYLEKSVRQDLMRAVAANSSLKEKIDIEALMPVLGFYKAALNAVRENAQGQAATVWANGTQAVDASFALVKKSLPLLEEIIQDRITAKRAQLMFMLSVTVVSLILAAYLFYAFFLVTQKGFDALRSHMEAMTRGDLTTKPMMKGKDEVAELMLVFKRMQTSLRDIVSRVRTTSSALIAASSEVASASTDLAARTEQAAASLQQSAASIEEMAATIKQTAGNAKDAAQVAGGNAQVAEAGAGVMSEVVSNMQQIQDASKKIGDIIGVIDGIAFQTNILALNASVEAARAGEQGRGFAVVASEVRSLATRSADAAREIKSLLISNTERVDTGTEVVQGAGKTMTELRSNARQIADYLGQISVASLQQSQGVNQVSVAVQQLDEMTQQNAALVEETSASAKALEAQAQELAQQVAAFKIPSAGELILT